MTHYFDKNPTSKLNEIEFDETIFNRQFHFVSASSLFSKHHLDYATWLLITKCDLQNVSTCLDLGCGWGAVAVILGSTHPQISFSASDVNERAVIYTKKNLKQNGVSASVLQSHIFENIYNSFDCILTNPPYVAGRKICYEFITQSFDHLNDGGSLQLVARHKKGGKMLAKKMQETFGNVQDIAKKGGFRIYKSIKTPTKKSKI